MKAKLTVLFIIFSYAFCFLSSVGFASLTPRTDKAELERNLSRQREDRNETDSRRKMPEADLTPNLKMSKVQITGNTVLSIKELLGKIPWTYIEYETDPATGKIKKDPETKVPIAKAFYDFRVLFEIIINPGKEREVSLKTIRGFTRYLLSVYEEKGYRGIYVYVPLGAFDAEGKLKNGILPVHVLEAKVAQIEVGRYTFNRKMRREGFLKDSVIRNWSPIKEGKLIQKKQLDDFVNLLNLSPDRYVSAVVSRADEPNVLDLTYEVYEANPWHSYVQVDDSGTKQRQWAPRIGLINTNVTGIDDRFSVQYQAPWEKGIEDEYAVFGMYDFPVTTPRLRLRAYGGYSEFDITTEGISFLGNGSLFGSILSYNIMQTAGWFVDLTGSLSRESSKVTPSLGTGSDVDMDIWGLGIQLHRRTERDMSNTMLTLNRSESMGGSSRDAFDEARTAADHNFAIYSISAAHTQYLDSKRVHRIKTSFRIVDPDSRLVPAKMTVFGGLYTLRGYEEDEIVADGGILLSGQYEFDIVRHVWPERDDIASTGSADRNKLWLRKLAPLVFVDFGRAKIEDPVPGEKRIQELTSVGVGAIAEVKDNFTGALYYGWPLRSTTDTDKGNGQLNISLVYRF
jgi:hemolysin activation/secretion protein